MSCYCLNEISYSYSHIRLYNYNLLSHELAQETDICLLLLFMQASNYP